MYTIFNKKYIYLLILLITGIIALSTVNASDLNISDDISANEPDELAIHEKIANDTLQTEEETNTPKEINSTATTTENTTPEVKKATISASKLTTTYKTSKNYQVKVKDNNGNPIKGITVKLKLYTGNKSKTYSITTNSNGIANYNVKSIAAGTHKLTIGVTDTQYTASEVTSSIKIKPKTLKIIVYNDKDEIGGVIGAKLYEKTKKSNKGINGIKINLKIYTGKKYKVKKFISGYSDDKKTKGIFMYITNMFSVGTHKVIISSGDKNYKFSKKTKLVITKKSKEYYKYYYILSNGKIKTNI